MLPDNFFKIRPLSYSQLSTFWWNKDDWYRRYVLKEKQEETPELAFGKLMALSIENGSQLAPVTILSVCEQEFKFTFNGIPCIGYADTFNPSTCRQLGEFKTGVKKWDQKRVDEHKQLDFYCLGNYIINKVKPEEVDIFLEWVPTKKTSHRTSGLSKKSDYNIAFTTDPPIVNHFNTKRTMKDIVSLGILIKKTIKEMGSYAQSRSLTYAKEDTILK